MLVGFAEALFVGFASADPVTAWDSESVASGVGDWDLVMLVSGVADSEGCGSFCVPEEKIEASQIMAINPPMVDADPRLNLTS